MTAVVGVTGSWSYCMVIICQELPGKFFPDLLHVFTESEHLGRDDELQTHNLMLLLLLLLARLRGSGWGGGPGPHRRRRHSRP